MSERLRGAGQLLDEARTIVDGILLHYLGGGIEAAILKTIQQDIVEARGLISNELQERECKKPSEQD